MQTAAADGADPAGLHAALRDRFGHPGFRPGQQEVVEAVLGGGDVVVVMPTGGGKSLTYQLPAVLDAAPTVVVSPLIALMKDQVDALGVRGIAAAALHSNIGPAEQRRLEAAYAGGGLRLLYVAPERLVRPDLRALLERRRPARIVVDEAHCISEWGHDFRRDYLRIGEVATALQPVQIVACTATATPAVRDDIVARLALRGPRVFVHGFARPELHLSVERVRDEATKLARLEGVVDPGDGHAIVYAGTRARAAEVAARLGRHWPTMLYHADLGAEERAAAHDRFASGAVRVAVATSAFGMGVDVASVRQVVHVALPASLEEYYQQAGRAGRDGHPARCSILYGPADRRLPEFFIEAAHPDSRVLAGVVRSLRSDGADPGGWRLVRRRDPAVVRLSDAAGDAARELLREAGVIGPDGRLAAVDPDHLPVDHGRVAAHRRLAFDRFTRLLDYVAGARCRHRLILDHFGEPGGAERCGDRCDVCDGRPAAARPVDSLVLRKTLSAVARLNGRVGLARIAAVLVGSRSRAVESLAGARDLPTYGALAGWREPDVAELLRRLVEAGAIRQAAPPYPTASLTRLGVAAMRGDESLVVDDPRAERSLPTAAGLPVGEGEGLPDAAARELFERLRGWRAEVARSRAVPPYVVFHDSVLRAVAAARPAGPAALLAVGGVGPGKLELYGAALLELVRSAPAVPGAAREVDGAPGDPP